jgi:hypothetical protein
MIFLRTLIERIKKEYDYGSNRLCNCDGMDECLSRKEKEAHKERAADNE